MDQRTRFANTLLFKPVDRIPNFEYWYMDGVIDEWHDQGLPDHVTPGNADAYFGLDVRRQECILPVNATSPIPAFTEHMLDETPEYFVRVYSDGIVRRIYRKHGYVEQQLAFPLESADELDGIIARFDPNSAQRYPAGWIEAAQQKRSQGLPVGLHLDGFFARARAWLGFENCCMGYHLQPKLMHAIGDFWADFCVAVVEKVTRSVVPDFAEFWEDMAFKTAPMVSPATFNEFLSPYYRRVIDVLRNAGVLIVLGDSDGRINDLLPCWLDVGINGMYPLEAQAGVDPVALSGEYGGRLAMLGGIDKKVLLADEKAIEAELRSKLPALGVGSGYIPTVDHRVPNGVPLRNWEFYLDLKKELLAACG